MFSFLQVTYRYNENGLPALNEISFDIPRHGKTALVGPNGAGKSTLIFHMNGLFRAGSGTVSISGEEVTRSNQSSWIKRVGVVFQDPDDQIVASTVREDAAFGPLQLGASPQEAAAKADAALSLLGIEELADLDPGQLSFGQKKLVAIAGIVAMDTEAVIIDEPMAFLDPQGQRQITHILELLSTQGKTVIIATHNMQLVAEWADHVVVIKDGTCLGQMSPKALFCTRPDLLEAARLELPPAAQLFSGLRWNPPESMPIRMEEANRWLIEQLYKKDL